MRADKFLADKFGSRTKCAEAIEKGLVLVNGKPIRPKDEISEADEITFIKPEKAFVSNGGYKLDRAIRNFLFSCKEKVFVDIGASTGGFTDCLLQNGAKRVYAVDVGESLLDKTLAHNPNVVVMENTNARYLQKEDFSERIDGVVTDVSFISLKLIFPVIKNILSDCGEAVVLIKPQFECENKNIGKSGIVRPSAHTEIVKKVLSYATENGLYPVDIVNAPVRKGKNIEYVLHIRTQKDGSIKEIEALNKVKEMIRLHSLGELE